MSTGVVLAVLLGALLHATWNALVKSSGDKQLDLALVSQAARLCRHLQHTWKKPNQTPLPLK